MTIKERLAVMDEIRDKNEKNVQEYLDKGNSHQAKTSQERLEYIRKWRKENPSKVHQYYLTEKAKRTPERNEELAQYRKTYYQANKERLQKYQKAYRAANKEKIRQYSVNRRKREQNI